MTPNFLDVLATILIYFILIYQYRRLNKSLILNPLSPGILIFAISIVTVNYFYRTGNINDKEYFILMLEFFIYFIFMLITPLFIKNNYSKLSNYMNINSFDIQIAKIVFYFSLILSLIYIFLLWSSYSSGSDRFILNRTFRELMLLNNLFSVWSLSISSIIYSKTKKNEFLIYSIIIISLSSFMGSRSAAIVGLLTFLFFYFQCNKINGKYLFLVIFIAIILLILPTYFMYGSNTFEMILNRIFLSADIYIWSFVFGDYSDYIDYYDPIRYILHPFSSLIGIRGYEYGFGAQIVESANLPVDGTGPNDQMPMLGLIFYNDCLLCIIVFTIIFSLIMMLTILFIFYFFSRIKISLSFRALIFSLLYSSSIYIFIGVNAFSFNIVIALLGAIIYFIFYILRNISSKKVLNNENK
jgi:hypothetical protein